MCGNPNTRFLIRLIIDIVLLICIYVIAFVGLPYWFEANSPPENAVNADAMTTPFTSTRRGFFCSDDSLRYPYKADTLLNGVHMTMLTIALPIAAILIVEMLRSGFRKFSSSSAADSESVEAAQKFTFVGLRIPTLISECYRLMGSYFFGLGLLLIAITFLKHWAGRLRPYFFDVCQPQLADNTNCDDDKNFGVYVVDYTCSELATVSADLLSTLRQSFPSGYVTCTAYALGFLILYLQARMRVVWLRLLRLSLQFVGAAILALVAVERVSSMRNHWTDVCAGMLLGLILAAFIAIAVLQLFQRTAAASSSSWIAATTAATAATAATATMKSSGMKRKKFPINI